MADKPVVTYDRTLGIVAMEGRGFSNPVDIAISSNQRIYVLSRTNPLQTYGIRIGICDLDSNYYGDFGSYGSGPGQFVWPTSLALDGNDNLYLADEYNHRITVFDQSGAYLSHWGEHGRGEGRLDGPSGLTFDSAGRLIVVDGLNNRVQKFTPDGRFISAFGSAGLTSGEFDMPWGVAVDREDSVYVADWRNDRIQKFSSDGDLVAVFGEPGDGTVEFHRPSSVCVDCADRIYVADWGNERVKVLSPNGELIQELRGQATLSKWAEEFYIANPDEKILRDRSELIPLMRPDVTTAYEESARTEPYFWGPISVKLDPQGRLYVTEANRHRIQVYKTV